MEYGVPVTLRVRPSWPALPTIRRWSPITMRAPNEAVFQSNGPEFGGDQDRQFLYNAIVENLSLPPSGSEFSEAGGSTGPADPPRP